MLTLLTQSSGGAEKSYSEIDRSFQAHKFCHRVAVLEAFQGSHQLPPPHLHLLKCDRVSVRARLRL